MRTRGWSGNVPTTDGEARARILAATRGVIDIKGDQTTIADVARVLGVTRQTIYHYFPSTDELLGAVAMDASWAFAGNLVTALRGVGDPAEAIVEGLMLALERLPQDPYIGVLLNAQHVAAFAAIPGSVLAQNQTRGVLERLDVDWSGFSSAALDDIVQLTLRMLQSFILSPVQPGVELRRLVHRWVGPVIAEAQRASRPRARRQRRTPVAPDAP
ncbi:TetR family transcriptional regulator [Mycolicibacterium canariasense]|uniref:TetR family transcriptional regulator n=2 Tax=Mycolicibacterium canariasense TaxID=228230 RepID=A0A100W923_MYCCR|nr:TetR/AcrR family transcriptional regulator [Mycolicibacterium canariasense]MCV7207470.1 TetR/AcrR family transcriptional regulator [Mycolicibacterium canariasense]ORV08714.1 TetR family transcriptional regulator [Mycolicibacterium canariasense]GAS93661.1 TetR family transcriptional regulator [Mycolicibacterium canariasense]